MSKINAGELFDISSAFITAEDQFNRWDNDTQELFDAIGVTLNTRNAASEMSRLRDLFDDYDRNHTKASSSEVELKKILSKPLDAMMQEIANNEININELSLESVTIIDFLNEVASSIKQVSGDNSEKALTGIANIVSEINVKMAAYKDSFEVFKSAIYSYICEPSVTTLIITMPDNENYDYELSEEMATETDRLVSIFPNAVHVLATEASSGKEINNSVLINYLKTKISERSKTRYSDRHLEEGKDASEPSDKATKTARPMTVVNRFTIFGDQGPQKDPDLNNPSANNHSPKNT